jgi:hypothetical protein
VNDLDSLKSFVGQIMQRVEALSGSGQAPSAAPSVIPLGAITPIKRERKDTKDGIIPKKRRRWVERTVIDLTGEDTEDEDI